MRLGGDTTEEDRARGGDDVDAHAAAGERRPAGDLANRFAGLIGIFRDAVQRCLAGLLPSGWRATLPLGRQGTWPLGRQGTWPLGRQGTWPHGRQETLPRGRCARLAYRFSLLSPAARLEAERARWFCWVPVAFGGGIGAYFSLPQEPSRLLLAALVFLSIAIWLVARRGTLAPFIAAGLIWGSAGAFAAALRADLVQAPVLSKPLEGRAAVGFLEAIEPRLPKGWRLTLRLKALEGVASDARPRRIRIVWAGDHAVRIGDAVRVRVFLRPPPIPVRPGGYDFARRAYFDQIGAVGFAVSRPERVRDLPRRPTLLAGVASIGAVRRLIAERVERAVPGETGALINALIVGERGRVSEPTLEHLRRSGLSHLLAISGMHMAMIAGALFAMLRVFFAAVPALALRFPIKKLAALAALAGGIGYLAVSGASVATQRAAIMIGLMLVAVLLDRPAISLRNVALAALVIMALGPENLLEIGFQMSFAAVVALVAFYEWWRDRPAAQAARAEGRSLEASRLLPAPIAFIWRGGRGLIVGTLVTTFIAGLAVAPLGAFHFHKIAQFSLAANLFAMPVFTLVVMPMALVSLLAMPLGLEGLPLSTMGWGVEQVRAVAADVSERPGAVRALVA
ncbi:MAG: ComEC/Rec2 family competence protein, partial [Pseudomonadota bacterium]